MDQKMQRCIDNCSTCHDMCLRTINYCLDKGGDYVAPDVIRTLMDCVQICHTSEDFMRRQSDLHPQTCDACAKVCRKCAEVCERFPEDEQMKQCAQACRDCAESCEEMASASH